MIHFGSGQRSNRSLALRTESERERERERSKSMSSSSSTSFAGGGGVRPWPSATSVSYSGKRIQKEMMEFNANPPTDCSAGPKGDNLYHWVSTILGPSGNPGSQFHACLPLLNCCCELELDLILGLA